MPRQNLTRDDMNREMRAVFALIRQAQANLFCMNSYGGRSCCRHKNHNGKHAGGSGQRVVRW